jgi:hypothetical protein
MLNLDENLKKNKKCILKTIKINKDYKYVKKRRDFNVLHMSFAHSAFNFFWESQQLYKIVSLQLQNVPISAF